ncbi:MAG: hypothetical protein Q9209_006275 [Squamulea sp. 1 TL-2023]
MAHLPKVYDPNTDFSVYRVQQFASLHQACITHDHMIATFIPPLSNDKVYHWWLNRVVEVKHGGREIVFMRAPDGSDGVIGVVMLNKRETETGPFRGVVENLLIARGWGRMGIATALMTRLEFVAREKGITLLV